MNTNASTEPHASLWYWSQRGTTLGPVDFAEIRRLVTTGSIVRDTWVFDPAQSAWVPAASVGGLFTPAVAAVPPAVPPVPAVPLVSTSEQTASSQSSSQSSSPSSSQSSSHAAPPPSAQQPSGSVVYCRFCGATNSPLDMRCHSCGRESEMKAKSGIDPRIAAIACRVSILLTPILANTIIGPALAPGIVWALGSRDPRVVAEAKQSFNCLLTLLIVLVPVWIFGLIGIVVILPTVFAGIVTAAAAIYCVVVGILGLIAASNDREFRYPWIIQLLK